MEEEKGSPEFYTLESLLENLEYIKKEGSGDLNFPKALYCLVKEIQTVKYRSTDLPSTNSLPISIKLVENQREQ